jgi:cytidylate kinase
MKIAIDGPAASGKSTFAAKLAHSLNYFYFDTGVMYRAVTLAALQNGIAKDNARAMSELAHKVKIDVQPPHVHDGRQSSVWLDGVDVSWEVRTPQVDANVSATAKHKEVRAELVRQQQRIAQQGNIVMAGRDIGTVVLPQAELKIYLTASVEERARRRMHEIIEHGEHAKFEEVLAAMRERDRIDTTREESPLRIADDAVVVDSTGWSREQTMTRLIEIVHQRQRELAN